MREILFRGQIKDTKEWTEGAYYHQTEFYGDICDYHYIITSKGELEDNMMIFDEAIPETIGQFTGLTDKNGTKIFEGDICKHRSNYSGDFIISVVTYTDGCFLAMADNNSGFGLSDNLEVIGNIHDNPELLEVGENA